MLIVSEYNFDNLYKNSWAGAIDTLNIIIDNDMKTEFMDFLEDIFSSNEVPPTETEVNDFIWFESDYIFESLGIIED